VFHSSPTSARVLVPLIEALMESRPVLGFDTLGNGESDKPPGWEIAPSWEPGGLDELSGANKPAEPWIDPTITDFAAVVVEALDTLGVEEIDLYGSLTGGLLAVETAIAIGPERTGSVIVDGLPWFTPEQEEQMLGTYTPPLEPRWDGSHLLFAWSFLRAAFEYWPWYQQNGDTIVPWEPPPTEFLHSWVSEFVKSGHTYPLAYRAAFRYRVEERLPLLESPLLVVAPEGDQMTPRSEPGAALAPNGIARIKPPGLGGQVDLYSRFAAGEAV
ncbi:MAG: alpha/beta fold hydrolase, partial [Gaiellaceae bacterium]